MFDTLRTTCCTISDIDIGAYLLLHGAKLEGVVVIAKNRGAYTFTHKKLSQLIHEYKQYKPLKFSPKAFIDMRNDLKRMTPDPAFIPDINR